jgi:oligopeptide transport system permease protein
MKQLSINTQPLSHEDSGNLWRDVWCDLRRNPSAIGGLTVMLLLIVFCQFGNNIWRVDPSAMDITQISQSPTLGRETLVIRNDETSAELLVKTVVNHLQTLETPNTESVTLAWPASDNKHFRIYRHELPPSGERDLGMPLTDTHNSFYVDQLRLENRTYYYSVATLNEQQQITQYNTLAVDVAHATPLSVLLEQGAIHNAQTAPAILRLAAHPFGTDKLGRDLLARLIEGGKVSLFVGLFAPLIFVLFGTVYGAIAGYLGGKTDTIMMAFADFIIALPFLLFMILLRIAFGFGPGDSGISALLFALIVLSWPNTARLVRGQVLQLRSSAYVDAARLQGASSLYIVWRHLLPNVFPSILVTLSFAIPSAIFTEAFLSFIGLGIVPPAASWGSLCNDGLAGFLTHPHELLFPAVFISLAVLAFNLVGDGLRDALDVQGREHS